MERHIRQLEYCTYCPKMCRHVCPLSNNLGRESTTPQAKMHLMNMLRRGGVSWSADTAEPLYACTTCRQCQRHCLHGNDVAAALERGRHWAERRRLAHPALERLPERFRERNERLQQKLHREFSPHLFAEEAQVGYFPGCDAIDSSIEDVHDALAVFASLDLSFVRLASLPYLCAGYPLWAAGCHEAARQVAEQLLEALASFSTLLVGCPACTHLLRERLPAEGFTHGVEILHVTEFLYIHAERLDIRRTRPAAIYHDPCYLGRYLGVYEPPRRLLSRCTESVREFFYSREDAACCGGGGLVPQTFPQAAAGQARRRLAEAEMFQVPLVVSSCPTCKRLLTQADSPVEVMDLLNLLAWCLHNPERPALSARRKAPPRRT